MYPLNTQYLLQMELHLSVDCIRNLLIKYANTSLNLVLYGIVHGICACFIIISKCYVISAISSVDDLYIVVVTRIFAQCIYSLNQSINI